MLVFAFSANAQVDSVLGQITNSTSEAFAGGISADGRFAVVQSSGNIATENPRNTDLNSEIFLFDYAQRRIYQITDTIGVRTNTTLGFTFDNIKILITNSRPVISRDGRWIAFGSNATTSTPTMPNSTNPGHFIGESYTASDGTNPLSTDANAEIWLYQIPATAPADLRSGDEIPATDLSVGTFFQVTNTITSRTPQPGSTTAGPSIADDNHDPSLSDDAGVMAFVSTRDLVPAVGNAFPLDDNDDIFTYVRATNTLGQVTKTVRGPISNPIYNKNPTISGQGDRVVFASTGDNPIYQMTGGNNPLASRNEEIFYADLVAGSPTAASVKKQITVTTPTNPGEPVNILDLGRRMSRDGRYIAFDSYADLATTPNGANSTAFATFLYDTTNSTFRQIGPRSNADTVATGGDVRALSRFYG